MGTYADFSDTALTALLKQGDHAAFNEIYRRYWALLYRNARKMLRDDQEATDLVQEIFTILWEKPPELQQNNSLSSYLYSATRNRIINQVNRKKLNTNYLESLQTLINSGDYQTDNLVRERELARTIEQEIANLPEKMRQIFELSRKENLSYKEIAEQVNISEGTVKKQVHNAIKILRPKFKSFFWMLF